MCVSETRFWAQGLLVCVRADEEDRSHSAKPLPAERYVLKFTRNTFGALLFPLLAIGYAIFALWEQFTGDYMELTTDYALLLSVPVLVLAGLVILCQLFPVLTGLAIVRVFVPDLSKQREPVFDAAPEAKAAPPEAHPGGTFRIAALVGCAFLLVFSIEAIGYLIGFFLFVVLVMLAMGIRSPVTILMVSLGTTLVVHFAFVELLDLPLPTGVLEDFLGWTE